MRIKLLSFLLLAGTVVGCSSNPPPPPMVEAPPPPPPPAPVALGPVDGMYKGMAELAADAPKGCAKMTREQTVRVRHNSFVLNGIKGTVAPDGAITAPTRHGSTVSGTASATGLDLMSMRGKCSYHYTMTKG